MSASSPLQLCFKTEETHPPVGSLNNMAMQTAHQTILPLAGRVAIVTGALGGIGRAVSLHLAALGARLVLNDLASPTQADILAFKLNSTSASTSHPHAIAVQANVTDPAAVKSLFDQAEQAFGSPAHILVTCAGIIDTNFSTIAKTTEEEWDKTLSVNAKGTFLCCREAANRLVKGGGGRIITISSSLVGALQPGYGAYTASKVAVESITRVLAKELKGTGITANCVAPGAVATELFFTGRSEEDIKIYVEPVPLGRLGLATDIAPVVGFLASAAGEWINGQVIRVNGGYN